MSGNEELNPKHKPKDLEFTIPGPDAPGFLRRQDKLIRFMHSLEEMELKNTYDPNLVRDMINFLLDFVKIPKDKDEAEEILWDLTQNQYMYVMKAIQAGGDDMVPQPSESN